jgi:hypothetical protein
MIKSRRRWKWHVAQVGKGNLFRMLMGRPEGEKPLGTPRRRWVDKIKMDHGEILQAALDGIGLIQDRDLCRNFITWKLTFSFHKLLRNSLVISQLADSQERFTSTEVGSYYIAKTL